MGSTNLNQGKLGDEKMINIAVCEDDVFLGSQIETMLYRQAEIGNVAIQTEVLHLPNIA